MDNLVSGFIRSARLLPRTLEALLLPPVTTPREPSNEDYRRIVLLVAGPAVGFFFPSLLLANVPQDLWLPFVVVAVTAGIWISANFLFVPRSAVLVASLAAVSNALIIGGAGWLYRDYFHEVELLFVLLVAAHAVVHGLAPALTAVALGVVVIPTLIQDPTTANWTDPYYAALYLSGAALIPWVAWRLAQRRAELLGTLRRASETEKSRLAAILGSMSDAVVTVDRRGTILTTNAAYDRLRAKAGGDVEPEDQRGRRLPRNRWPQARAARGDLFRTTFTLKASDGQRRWYEATGGPIGGSERVVGGVVVIRDITDRSLRRLQEEFMAVASHELRTPVAALHGYLQLLERNLGPGAAPEAGYARNALSQTRRLGHLLDRLFDLARFQTGSLAVDLQPMDVVPVIRRAVTAAQTLTTDQHLSLDVKAQPLRVYGDPGRFEEVMLNLLTNAIVHAPESKRIEIRALPSDGLAEVQIHDHGPGIPRSELARVFSRRGRPGAGSGRANGGLGLGLYISRELMRAQGGTVEVASAEGAGTTVTVRLPLLALPRTRVPRTRP